MKYQNPVVRGMYPDPSVCRVGDKFYMVCSSMQLFPGVPLFESDDMVHWNQIGHCLTRASQIDLNGVRSSGGVFAPTIRYNDGHFYMVTTNDSYHQNFYVTTDDIYGEWSEPVNVDQDGIDPSLFFEDGHSYFISNGADTDGKGCVQMCEIDIATGKKLSESRVLWKGTGGRFLEAPHLYRFGDYYYLLEAEGGTEYGHMVNYARSESMWGPFEPYPKNPVLTNRNLGGYPIQGAGHGDIVDDGNGNWWFAHLAFRQIDKWFTFHHLGREVCVVPLHWQEDGWFTIGMDGTTPIDCEYPEVPDGAPQELDIKKTFADLKQNRDWTYLRIPTMENYKFTPYSLSLKGTKTSLDMVGSPTFAGVRQCEFNTNLRCTIEPGDAEAGITVYMDEIHHYEVVAKKENGKTAVFTRQTIGVLSAESQHVLLDTDAVNVHITSDSLQYQFYVEDADKKEIHLSPAETRYLSSEVAGGFTGVIIGFYAVNSQEEKETWSTFTNFALEMSPEKIR